MGDEVRAFGVWSFLNDENGVWFKRDEDGNGKNPRGPGKSAKRTSTRTNAIAEAGVERGILRFNPQPVIQPRLSSQPLMPRPRLVPRPGMGRVGVRGPFLSAVEVQPDCNAAEDFAVLAMVFMLALIVLKRFRRLQTPTGTKEPLMYA